MKIGVEPSQSQSQRGLKLISNCAEEGVTYATLSSPGLWASGATTPGASQSHICCSGPEGVLKRLKRLLSKE